MKVEDTFVPFLVDIQFCLHEPDKYSAHTKSVLGHARAMKAQPQKNRHHNTRCLFMPHLNRKMRLCVLKRRIMNFKNIAFRLNDKSLSNSVYLLPICFLPYQKTRKFSNESK